MQTGTRECASHHLGERIDQGRAGEEIIMARGGMPIARLVPVEDRAEQNDEAHAPDEEVDEAFHGD